MHTFSLCLHDNLNWRWLQNTSKFISIHFFGVCHTILQHELAYQQLLDSDKLKMFIHGKPKLDCLWPTPLRFVYFEKYSLNENQMHFTWAPTPRKINRPNFRLNQFDSVFNAIHLILNQVNHNKWEKESVGSSLCHIHFVETCFHTKWTPNAIEFNFWII